MDANDFITEARANVAKGQARVAAHKIAIAEVRLEQIKNNDHLKDHEAAAEKNLADALSALESAVAVIPEVIDTPDVP